MRLLLPPLLLAACGDPTSEPVDLLPGTTPLAPGPVETATWREVAPILEGRCVRCHQEGQVGPFPLDDYEQAWPRAGSIAAVTRARRMPPYLVDPTGACQEFVDPGWLAEEEIGVLEAWAEAGAPAGEGPPRHLEAPQQDHLDRADAVLDMGVEYAATGAADEVRCFLADPGLTEDRYLTAFEVIPGNPAVVHHVILYTLDTPEAVDGALALDAADEVAGYECFGSIVLEGSRTVAGWAVGTPTTRLPAGTGLPLVAGQPLLLQVHYHSEGPAAPDRTIVELELEEEVPKPGLAVLLYDTSLLIPAGRPDWTFSFETTSTELLGFPVPLQVHGVFPHMHTRGTSMRLEVERAGGTECLYDVPYWDFDWQRSYFYTEPITIGPDDTIRVTCSYDTTGIGLPVEFGESTDDEMCIAGALVTL